MRAAVGLGLGFYPQRNQPSQTTGEFYLSLANVKVRAYPTPCTCTLRPARSTMAPMTAMREEKVEEKICALVEYPQASLVTL